MSTAPTGFVTGRVPSVTLYSGYMVLCSALDGEIGDRRHGLFDFDARVVSRYRLTVDGTSPELVSSTQIEADSWFAVLRLSREGGDATGPLLPQDALEITLRRHLGGRLTEELSVANRSQVPLVTTVELALDSDFMDIAHDMDLDLSNVLRVQHQWDEAARTLVFECKGEREGRRFERTARIQVRSSAAPQLTDSGLTFSLSLGARETWRATLETTSSGRDIDRAAGTTRSRLARRGQRRTWQRVRPVVEPPGPLASTFDRAAEDLFDLRNFELEEQYAGGAGGSAWVTNAGVPTFTGLFGRDVLTAAWQSGMLGPRAAHGALAIVAATQSETDDPWRDSEPGKMIHEMRRGPLSVLGITPRDAYYGSQTTPHMFLLALSELWHWTSDTEVLRRYRDAAVRSLEWAAQYGDPDGDGFLEYERRSPMGLRNQGWKDSDEAIRYPDGRIVDGPIATVEEQAFYFLAQQRMAEILLELGEEDLAGEYLDRASALKQQWHEAFWMPDEGFYALALDGRKQQVKSITSNPGHALATGIVPVQHARAVADRLMSDELFSGWGVRTLSAQHPSFNPFAYHLGTVWPVEQATFALGFKRFGLDDHATKLAKAVLDAAWLMPEHRLPEAISGHARAELDRPVPYPQACSPQAWSASATIQMVQVLLGLYPFAPLGILAIVRPRLPESLPELTIRRLKVGRATVDIKFTRQPDGSASHKVIRRRGPLILVPAGPPETVDERSSLPETLIRGALRAGNAKRLRAARIALGLSD